MRHSQQIAVVQMRPHEYGLTKAAYSVNETLHLLSVGRTSLYQLVKDGELVPTKFGKKTLFSAPDLATLLNKRRSKPPAAPEDGAA